MSTLRLYEIADTYLRALEDLADIEDLLEQAIADTLALSLPSVPERRYWNDSDSIGDYCLCS